MEHDQLVKLRPRRRSAAQSENVALGSGAIDGGRVISIGNLKGGTGKSTLSVNLACALARHFGQRVCLVDTDPQGTAHRWSQGGKLPIAVEPLPLKNLATASGWLGETELLRHSYDLVVVDLPAVVPPATAAAFMLADVIMVPVPPSSVDMDGAARAMRFVRVAREQRPDDRPDALIVPSRMLDRRRIADPQSEDYDALREKITTPLRFDPLFPAAFAQRRWIGDFAPKSMATKDVMRIADRVWETLRQRERRRSAPLEFATSRAGGKAAAGGAGAKKPGPISASSIAARQARVGKANGSLGDPEWRAAATGASGPLRAKPTLRVRMEDEKGSSEVGEPELEAEEKGFLSRLLASVFRR